MQIYFLFQNRTIFFIFYTKQNNITFKTVNEETCLVRQEPDMDNLKKRMYDTRQESCNFSRCLL